jgi:hypothetical protein
MRPRALVLVSVAAIALAACSGPESDPLVTIPPGKGADTALAAVDELVNAVNAAEFSDASRLAVPHQAALASLAEGATFGDVAEALRQGDEEVAANFWAGFAQGTGSFLTGTVDLAADGTIVESGVEFEAVQVTPESSGTRTILLRDVDGFRIDLFASFGAGLADKMTPTVERLLGTQTADSRLILTELQEIVPSLLAAAGLPGTPGDVSQQLLALVEVITRVG